MLRKPRAEAAARANSEADGALIRARGRARTVVGVKTGLPRRLYAAVGVGALIQPRQRAGREPTSAGLATSDDRFVGLSDTRLLGNLPEYDCSQDGLGAGQDGVGVTVGAGIVAAATCEFEGGG